MKPRNPDRLDLYYKIIKLANLPGGNKLPGYFTRQQLIELAYYLEYVNKLVTEAKEAQGGN